MTLSSGSTLTLKQTTSTSFLPWEQWPLPLHKDCQEGYNMPLDVSCAQWQGDYIWFMRLIGEMREDVVVHEWPINYQKAIMAQGRTSCRSWCIMLCIHYLKSYHPINYHMKESYLKLQLASCMRPCHAKWGQSLFHQARGVVGES